MTAAAMIIGMLPMSMANSQNAPLGRAVMGGLLIATLFTLYFRTLHVRHGLQPANRSPKGACLI